MKKLIPFLFAVLALASCEKEPDLDKVQNDYVVYTQYDKDASFTKGNTFYIADSVLLIGDNTRGATYLDGEMNDFIIDAYSSQMQSRGYTKALTKDDATYGLQISYVESTYYYMSSPSWWSSYPWYWSPSYWWPWFDGGWYHPYPFIYSYTNGSIVCEMVDITAITETSESTVKPTVIWNNYISGIATLNTKAEQKLSNAIDQSFKQSTYIQYK